MFSDALGELLEINADADADQSCEISCVRGGIQRFSIRGQGSLALLGKVLQTVNKKEEFTGPTVGDVGHASRNENMNNEDFFRSVLTYQPFSRIWKENTALGVFVEDVRKLTSYHRNAQLHESEVLALSSERAQDDSDGLNYSPLVPCDRLKKKLVWPAASSSSPLWSAQQRSECSRKFVKDDEMNKNICKSRQSISSLMQHRHGEETFHNPTSVNTAPKQDVSIPFPVIVIRKDLKNISSKRMSSKKGLPFLGFDILLPSGWGAAVWRAFQFAGAIAIGTEELDSIQLDHGVASFPRCVLHPASCHAVFEKLCAQIKIESEGHSSHLTAVSSLCYPFAMQRLP